MSFWEDKPVSIKKDLKIKSSNQILSNEHLLEKINNELENNKIQLEYSIIINPSSEERDIMLNFINKNYRSKNENLTLNYSKELLDYYIREDTLCILFYPKKLDKEHLIIGDKLIGLIMGQKNNVYVRDFMCFKNYSCIDVDFLCLKEQFRNMHVSSYMINIITKVCIERNNIGTAIYTVNKKLRVTNFSKKTYYHRPINVLNLLSTEILNSNDNSLDSVTLFQKLYNSFSYSKNFINKVKLEYILETDNIEYIQEIHDKLLIYCRDKYDIYDYKSVNDIIKIFKNKAFHKFIIRDANNKIIDFICLYNLETKNVEKNILSRNGHLYCMFISNDELYYTSYILELISEYIYKNDIFDLITVMDIFDINDEDYSKLKLLKGSADLYYYFYNVNLSPIDKYRNGLVTI